MVEKQMKDRRMLLQGSEPTHISDKDNDEIHLLYPEELDGWSICHLWKDKVSSAVTTHTCQIIHTFLRVNVLFC